MITYCLKDHITGKLIKVLLTKEDLDEFMANNPHLSECVDCIECDDSPSIFIE